MNRIEKVFSSNPYFRYLPRKTHLECRVDMLRLQIGASSSKSHRIERRCVLDPGKGLLVLLFGVFVMGLSAKAVIADDESDSHHTIAKSLGISLPKKEIEESLDRWKSRCEQFCFQKVLEICDQGHLLDAIDPKLLDALKDHLGRSLLIAAVQQLNEQAVKNLLLRKIAITRRDTQGNTPLHIAVAAGRTSLVPLLKNYLSNKNTQRETPLHTAIKCEHDHLVNLLLEMGASTSEVCDYRDLSLDPFKLSVAVGHTPTFDLLVKHGNFDLWDPQVGNLLHLALESKNSFMLKHLLSHYREETKGLINRQDGIREDGIKGISVLSLACIKGDLPAIELLKDAGANLDLLDSLGRTAAHWAALHQQIEVLETLAYLGADLTIRDTTTHQCTPEDYYPQIELERNRLHQLILNRRAIDRQPPNFGMRPPHNLVLNGEMHLIGALQALEDGGYLGELHRIAGSSTGALIAVLLAVGYDMQELQEALTACVPIQGEDLKEKIDQLVAEKTKIKDCTFGELQKWMGQKSRQITQLHIYVTQKYPADALCFSTSNPTWNEAILSEIIYAALPHPDFSDSHPIYYKDPYNHKRYHKAGEGAVYIQGECSQFPIDAFDNLEFQQSINKTTWNRKSFNHRTLGIYCSEQQLSIEEENKARILHIPIEKNELPIQAGRRAVEQAPFLKKIPGYISNPVSRRDTNLFSESLHPNFIKRIEIFERISKNVSANTEAGVLIHLLHGLPGMGKTQIAMQYADQHRHKFSNIWVIDGRDKDRSYRMIAGRMGLPDLQDMDILRQMVQRQLEERADDKPWLLIFDNVDAPLTAKDFPEKKGHVIVTTTQASIVPFHHYSHEIGPLKPQEAIQLIRSITREEESNQMRRLAKDLSYFPLALNMAAHFIASNCSISDYIQEYDCNKRPIEAGMSQDAIYQHTLETVWDITFQKIKNSPDAFSWLNICAYLKPDEIPNSWLKKWAKDQGRDWLKIKDFLRDYSLIQHGQNHDFMAMHGLLQAVVRSRHTDDVYSSYACALSQEALGKFDRDNNETWQEGLMGYTQLMWMIEKLDWVVPVSIEGLRILKQLNIVSRVSGEIKRSAKINFTLFSILSQVFQNKDDEFLAAAYCGAAQSFIELDEIHKALQMYNEALQMYIRLYESRPHENTANTLMSIGGAYKSLGHFEQAEYYLALSFKMMHELYGYQPNLDFATLLNNLGGVFREQRKFELARECYEESFQMMQKLYPNELHPSIATSLNNLGLLWLDLRNLQKAHDCFERSLKVQKNLYKNMPHPNIATTLDNMAGVWMKLGKPEEALACIHEALDMQYKIYGDHPSSNVAVTLHNAGSLYYRLGDLEKARYFHEQSLNMKLKIYNEPHSYVIISLKSVAEVLEALGEIEKAKEYYSRAYEMQKITLGVMHVDTIETKLKLSSLQVGCTLS